MLSDTPAWDCPTFFNHIRGHAISMYVIFGFDQVRDRLVPDSHVGGQNSGEN